MMRNNCLDVATTIDEPLILSFQSKERDYNHYLNQLYNLKLKIEFLV